MKLKTFLASVRRYRQTFVVVAGVVFVLGGAWILLAPAKFVSTTQLNVSIAGSTTATAYQNDDVVAGRVNSYIALLTSDVVNQRVIDRLGLSLTAPELADKVSATNVPPRTSVIDVAVTDRSPAQAQLLAKTLASEFINYAEALETPTGEDGQKVRTTVVTAASAPHGQLFERILLGVLAAVTALVLGAVAVWIRSRTDPVVRTAEQAAAAAGVPVIGCVTSARGDDLEGYRRLRTRLSMTSRTGEADERGRVWVCTSAVGEVDTTVVATNLGRVVELAGSRSIVLDVSVSPWAGDPDLAATKAAAGLFDQLRNEYAQVIVAAPPVLKTITASIVSEYADGVLLVVELDTTKRRDLGRAADNLRATDAPLTGTVLSEKMPAPDVARSDNDGKRSSSVSRPHALTSDR